MGGRQKVGAARGRQVDNQHLKSFSEEERGPTGFSIWLGRLDLLGVSFGRS